MYYFQEIYTFKSILRSFILLESTHHLKTHDKELNYSYFIFD